MSKKLQKMLRWFTIFMIVMGIFLLGIAVIHLSLANYFWGIFAGILGLATTIYAIHYKKEMDKLLATFKKTPKKSSPKI